MDVEEVEALYQPTPIKRHSPERAVMLQRYLALTSQQSTLLRTRISSAPSPPLSPKASPDMTSSTPSSASASPTLSGQFSPISPPAFALPRPRKTSSRSPTIPAIPEDDVVSDLPLSVEIPDQDRLIHINNEIKSTLTEMLNCEAVKSDPKMRQWIQTRLMDAEMELKRQRRRRVSTPTITPFITLSPSGDDEDYRRCSA